MARVADLEISKGIFQTSCSTHELGGQAGHPSVGAEQLHCALPVLGFIPLSLSYYYYNNI